MNRAAVACEKETTKLLHELVEKGTLPKNCNLRKSDLKKYEKEFRARGYMVLPCEDENEVGLIIFKRFKGTKDVTFDSNQYRYCKSDKHEDGGTLKLKRGVVEVAVNPMVKK